MSKRPAPELEPMERGLQPAAGDSGTRRRRRPRGGRRAAKPDTAFDVAFVVEELVRDVEAVDALVPGGGPNACGGCGSCDSDDDECGGCGECVFFGGEPGDDPDGECRYCRASKKWAKKDIRKHLQRHPAESAAKIREQREERPATPFRCPSLVRLAPHPGAAGLCACVCCSPLWGTRCDGKGITVYGCDDAACCRRHLGRTTLEKRFKGARAERAAQARDDAEEALWDAGPEMNAARVRGARLLGLGMRGALLGAAGGYV